jgi:hypothetical protein
MARGTIYFVQSERGGPIKIGFTDNLKRRLASMRTHSADKLVVLATCKGDLTDERRLHERFAAHRVRGEWFAPAAELLAAIRSNAPLSSCAPRQESLALNEKVRKYEMSVPRAVWEQARARAASEGISLVAWNRKLIERAVALANAVPEE